MSEEDTDESHDRGALVLQPKAPAEGTFALLLPGGTCWEMSHVDGAIRLDFRYRVRDERTRATREDDR